MAEKRPVPKIVPDNYFTIEPYRRTEVPSNPERERVLREVQARQALENVRQRHERKRRG
jgi:hypothetical protein